MAFSPQFLDEIRMRVSLPGTVGRRVKLVKKGREYSGLCPFHNEKSPSFTINEEKGFFHCFGCGAHGDVFGFLMRSDGVSFPEAVERLAQEAGLEVPVSTPFERERAQRQAGLHEVMEKACAFYEAQLRTGAGRQGLDYLRGRDFDDQTIAKFRLGFAPPARGVLRQALMSEQMPEAMLIEAGLLGVPEDGGASYERFRGRVMFPITDRRGRVIAFGGRILGDGKPKYLNSPETPLFDKGRVLYGWATARRAAHDKDRIIVTEGYTDVIALARAGFPESVAPLGTALTESQLHELWRIAPEPLLCFDGDAAGQRAAWRAAERALPLLTPGYSVRFVTLPTGEDPDSLIASQGAEAMAKLLETARPLDAVIWDIEMAGKRIDTPERLAGLKKRLSERAFAIADRDVQGQYLAKFRQKIADLNYRSSPRRQFGKSRAAHHMRGAIRGGSKVMAKRMHQVLLACMVNHPALLDDFAENLAMVDISDSKLNRLREEILLLYSGQSRLDSIAIRCQLEERGLKEPLQTVLGRETYDLGGFARPGSALDTVRVEMEAQLEAVLKAQSKSLRRAELQEAGKAWAVDKTDENWARFEKLTIQSQEESDSTDAHDVLTTNAEDIRERDVSINSET
jgi:DNA primase